LYRAKGIYMRPMTFAAIDSPGSDRFEIYDETTGLTERKIVESVGFLRISDR
jgi:hypothetical protein